MFLDEKKSGEALPDLGSLRVDRILMLAEEIERPTRGWGFNINGWSCGTTYCIGGHILAMFCNNKYLDDDDLVSDNNNTLTVTAGMAIGISLGNATRLFYGGIPEDVTRYRAARVLRYLAATGKVDWSV